MIFADPKNDLAFKKIFGDKNKREILISFLNSVLELPSPIKSLSIASPYQVPRIKDLKDTYLKGINFHFAKEVKDAVDIALVKSIY